MKKLLPLLLPLLFLAACELDNDNTPLGTSDFIGVYSCQETSQLYGNSTYNVQIEAAPNVGEVLIKNFYNDNLSIRMKVDGTNLSLPSQTEGGFIIEGDGQSDDQAFEFDLTYLVDDGVDIDNCSATFTRQ